MRIISCYTWQIEAYLCVCVCDRRVMWDFVHRVPLKINIATTIKAVLHITCVKFEEKIPQ